MKPRYIGSNNTSLSKYLSLANRLFSGLTKLYKPRAYNQDFAVFESISFFSSSSSFFFFVFVCLFFFYNIIVMILDVIVFYNFVNWF